MTIRNALRAGIFDLRETSETPFLDAVLLLSEVLNMTKEKIISAYPEEISHEDLFIYRNFLKRRKSGKPVSYIRKKKEFWSHPFYVDERVLVPRPDTELLVETALELAGGGRDLKTLHDLCTGSGCVAITLKYELPWLAVSASDISPEAGEVFAMNSERLLGLALKFYLSDLLDDVPGAFDMITANPPYLTTGEAEAMAADGWPEPGLALDGGKDGLFVLDKIITAAPKRLRPGGYLLLEACPDRMTFLEKLMADAGFSDITVRKDLAEKDRVIHGKWIGYGQENREIRG